MASAAPSGAPRRILVADDDRDGVETLAILLRADGHDVRVASDGPTTLEVAREFRPNVIFLDLGMPGMHGYEIAGELRRMEGLDTTLLVALTGYSRELDRQRAYEAGFDVFLVKPTSPRVLAEVATRTRR